MDFRQYMQIVGENLRVIRSSKKVSRKALAETIHITEQYIGKIERGETNPSLEVLFLIANALDVSITSIIGESQELYSPKLSSLLKKYKFTEKNNIYRLLGSFEALNEEQINMIIKMISGLKN